MTAGDVLLNPIEELRMLAGVGSDVNEFDLSIDGARIRVTYTGGSSHWLRLSIPYDALAQPLRASSSSASGYRDASVSKVHAIRPMNIKLRSEGPAQIEGKATGGDVEHQTGDTIFDGLVYIDAPSTDPLLPMFAIEEVRKAVVELFKVRFDQIDIDDSQNHLTASSFLFTTPTIESHSHGSRGAKAFVRLARSLPQIQAKAGEQHKEGSPLDTVGTALSGFAIIMMLVCGPAYFAIHPRNCSDGGEAFPCLFPGMVGAAIAIVLAVAAPAFVRPFLRKKYGGTSSSSRHLDVFITGFRASVFFTALLFVSIIVMIVQEAAKL